MNLKQSGIYQILNIVNGKVYIGSATNLQRRRNRHFRDLINDKHHSKHLQNAWRKYQEDCFKFEVLEFVDDINILIAREQYWMDTKKSYDEKHGYNILPTAGSTLGSKHSEETIAKKSLQNRGELNALAILTEKEVIEIKLLLMFTTLTQKEIASLYGVGAPSINLIKLNKRWKHVKVECDSLPDHLAIKAESVISNKRIYNFTVDDILKIKEMLKQGTRGSEIAKLYNVSNPTISDIRLGKTWGHIGEDLSNMECKPPYSKVNDDIVREIKELIKQGDMTQTKIAEMYKVSTALISQIKTGKFWSHVVI